MATIETIRRLRFQQLSEGGDAARRDLLATAEAHRALGSAANSAAIVTDLASRKQLSANDAFDRAIRSVDGTAAAFSRYERQVLDLTRGYEQGGRSLDEYNRGLELARIKYENAAAAAQRLQAVQQSAAAEMQRNAGSEGKRAAIQVLEPNLIQARDRGADIEAYGKEMDRLRERLVPVAAAEREFASTIEMADRAVKTGAISQTEYATVLDRAQNRLHDQKNEIDKAEAAHKRLASGAGLSAYAYQNLSFQVNDVVTSLASGISPMQTLAQQGGQIYQILQMGEGGVGGALKGIGQTVTGAIRGMGLLGGTFAGVATAAAAAAVAGYQFNSSQTETARLLMGVGRASGATVGQIEGIANATASAGGVSVREARAMAQAFASTGQIGVEMFGGLIEVTKGYAKVMGQDLPTASAALAQAFSDPEKGVVNLNRQLLIFNASGVENIQTLARQGDRLGAMRALQAGVAQATKDAAELTTGWSRAFDTLANKASNAFTAIGAGVDKFLTGGDLETRIKDLQAVLSSMPESPGGVLGFLGVGAQRGAIQSELDAAIKQQQAIRNRTAEAQRANNGLEVEGIVDRYKPAQDAIKKLEQDAAKIEAKLGDATIDKRGEARRQMEALRAQAAALKGDLAAGGQALADSLKNAQFENRMVGAVGFGRSAADINRQQDEKIADATRNRGTDAASFDAKVKAIEDERRVLLDTLTKTTTQAETAIGGAFSRMSAEVQEQLRRGAARFPRVPVGVAAAIAQAESSGNLDVGRTGMTDENGKAGTAYGLGQITRSTGIDLQRRTGIDRMNRATQGEALAGVLDMKIEQANGDLFKALMNYRGSRDQSVNRAYATNILRNAGQLGDPSAQAVGVAQDAATRATRDQADALRRTSELYGVNTEKLNSTADAQAKYNALLDAGMAPNEELRKTLLGLASAAERANRDVSLVQFRRDNAFERDQLGRTDMEARAYSAARGRFGDVNDPRARTMIGESMETSRLQELKYTVGDTVQGFVTDLRRATSPLDALANAANRVADKLLGKFIDSFVSSAFGSTGPLGGAGAGGGIGDFFKSIFPFANGGIMTSAGPLPLKAYSRGGVAHSPQLALHAEGGMPEAYVPLPDGRSIPVTVQAQANNNNAQQARPAEIAIFNFTGQPVERKTTNGPRGPREEIVIGKAVAAAMMSGELDEPMRRRFGQKATG